MTKFTASNGHIIHRTSAGALALGNYLHLSPGEEAAWREFFQHERDEELGRWRWPENPNVVVYLDGDASRRSITVVFEQTGGVVIGISKRWLDSVPDEGHESHQAARAYFEAHPERKTWEDAKHNEIWVLFVAITEEAYRVDGDAFVPVNSPGRVRIPLSDDRIRKARRIWPEGDAS